VQQLTGNGGALWHIFLRRDADLLRQFLRDKYDTTLEGDDPIHAHRYYLTKPLLRELAERYKVVPFEIHQRVGDAVFIPAGCPHQASVHAQSSGCVTQWPHR